MAKIRLVKGSAIPTKRNIANVLNTYLPYVSTVGTILLALKVFNII